MIRGLIFKSNVFCCDEGNNSYFDDGNEGNDWYDTESSVLKLRDELKWDSVTSEFFVNGEWATWEFGWECSCIDETLLTAWKLDEDWESDCFNLGEKKWGVLSGDVEVEWIEVDEIEFWTSDICKSGWQSALWDENSSSDLSWKIRSSWDLRFALKFLEWHSKLSFVENWGTLVNVGCVENHVSREMPFFARAWKNISGQIYL